LPFRVIGTVVVLLAIFCCVAAGVLATRTTHVPESRTAEGQAKRERAQARVVAAERRVALTAGLSFVPPSGATAVAPDTPIVVTADSGTISAVSVTSTTAPASALDFHWSNGEWRSESALAYGAEYHVTATVSGPADVKVQQTATFRTLAPAATLSVSVFPNSGLTLGVGQPVAFRFSRSITSAAARAAERNAPEPDEEPDRGGDERRREILSRHRQRAARARHQGDGMRVRGHVHRARRHRTLRGDF